MKHHLHLGIKLLLLTTFTAVSIAFARTDQHPLKTVEETIALQGGVVVFDLDDTLFDTAGRHKQIMRELKDNVAIQAQFPNETRLIFSQPLPKYHYHLDANLKAFGITNPEFIKVAKTFWQVRFFANDYLIRDELVPGGVEYVQRLHDLGAKVVYLTGRDETMRSGSLTAFQQAGLPLVTGQDELLMKPVASMDDTLFKQTAIEHIKSKGTVVASFDNEPANANLFMNSFPAARNFFLNTRHSGKPVQLNQNLLTIADFEYEKAEIVNEVELVLE